MSQDIVDTTNLGGDMSDRGRYIVEAIVLEHRSPSELARTHKVSRSWIYKMLERFKRSCAHQVEARVQKLILKLRRDLTAAEDDPERAVRAASTWCANRGRRSSAEARARAPCLDADSRDRGTLTPVRHSRRCPRHRQEQARLRAFQEVRSGARADHLAAGSLPIVWRRRQLL